MRANCLCKQQVRVSVTAQSIRMDLSVCECRQCVPISRTGRSLSLACWRKTSRHSHGKLNYKETKINNQYKTQKELKENNLTTECKLMANEYLVIANIEIVKHFLHSKRKKVLFKPTELKGPVKVFEISWIFNLLTLLEMLN